MTGGKQTSRRAVLKSAAAGTAIAGIGVPIVTAQGRQTVTLTTNEGWITATVNAGQRTAISVELDDEVYDRWPDNATEYVMEANIGVVDPDTGVNDDFRIGWGGADTVQRNGTAGGYIRRNVDGTHTDYLEEEVQGLFRATESSDQQSYEFVINWQTPLPEKPDRIRSVQVNEVFGLDGGEGVQTEGIEVSTGASGEFNLTGN